MSSTISSLNLTESGNHLRAIMVSVDYADLLSLTLPWNRHHFQDVMIVTSTKDVQSREVARANGCQFFVTDSFYSDGASFNKWLALEQGLDVLGRHGWLCIMDADVLWPRVLPDYSLEVGRLYSPLRRMHERLDNVYAHTVNSSPTMSLSDTDACSSFPYITSQQLQTTFLPFPPESEWWQFPIHRNIGEWAGYSQVFHANDPVLGKAPWHEVNWKHAGGADSFFQMKWSPLNKVRPPFEVLHLGQAGQNWYGRATPYLDGSLPLEHVTRSKQQREVWESRRGKYGTSRFDGEKIKPEE